MSLIDPFDPWPRQP